MEKKRHPRLPDGVRPKYMAKNIVPTDEDINTAYGDALQAAIDATVSDDDYKASLTRERLAEMVDVDVRTIYNIVYGRGTTLAKAVKLAAIFDLSLDALYRR